MIGEKCLRALAQNIEAQAGKPRCRGDFVLAVQRALFGSVRVALNSSELGEVLAFLEPTVDSGKPQRRCKSMRPISRAVAMPHALPPTAQVSAGE